MNPLTRLALPLCVALSCTGCIIVSTSKSGSPPPPAPQPGRTVVVPAGSEDALTLAEIDAAVKLDFEGNRVQALTAIAKRPRLCPCVQVHLVNVAYDHLDFEGNQMTLLKTLIAQPAFCNPAKERVLVQLQKLDFEGNRSAILAALNQRGRLD